MSANTDYLGWAGRIRAELINARTAEGREPAIGRIDAIDEDGEAVRLCPDDAVGVFGKL